MYAALSELSEKFFFKSIHLFPKWPPRRKHLVQVAQKQGHKDQFGWNKILKKVSQFMLQNNCHFPPFPNLFSSPWNICKTV